MNAFKTIKASEYELQTVQDNVRVFNRQLEVNPLLSGILLKDISVISGSNSISHRLGRVVQGWFVVDQNAAITLYKDANQPSATRTLNLTSSGAATISLYVF